MSTAKSVLEMAKKQGAKMVDVKFVDTFGTWQHFRCPIGELTEEVFSDGFGFDGSSIRGWKSIEATDMLAMPDPATAFIDPFMRRADLELDLHHRRDRHQGGLQPRSRAASPSAARNICISTGMADTAVFGPEAEFFIFDNVQFDAKSNGTFYSVDSRGGHLEHRAGGDAQPGLQDPAQGGIFPGGARRTRSRTSAPRCAW